MFAFAMPLRFGSALLVCMDNSLFSHSHFKSKPCPALVLIYIYCDFEDVHLVLDVGAFFTWWRRFRFFTRRHLDDRTRFAKQALLHLLAFSLWPTPGSF